MERIQALDVESDSMRIVGEGVVTATIAQHDACIRSADGVEGNGKLGNLGLPLRST